DRRPGRDLPDARLAPVVADGRPAAPSDDRRRADRAAPGTPCDMTTNVVQTVDVAVPVTTAYNQWTHFESFPEFMAGLDGIDQLAATPQHSVASTTGVDRDIGAENTEDLPDERHAWLTKLCPPQPGVVTSHRSVARHSPVTLEQGRDPWGVVQKTGDARLF